MKWFKRLAKMTTFLVFVAMLCFNILTLTVSSVFTAMSALISGVAGVATIKDAHTSKLAVVDDDLKAETAKSARLEREIADVKKTQARKLSALDADLREEKLKSAKLEREVFSLKSERMVVHYGKSKTVAEAVDDTAHRIVRRTTIGTARNVASMPLEAVPLWGIAAIVGATTWEVTDACLTAQDMYELQKTLSPNSKEPVDPEVVCGIELPTKDELKAFATSGLASIRTGASDLSDYASEVVGGLTLPDFDMPELDFDVSGLFGSDEADDVNGMNKSDLQELNADETGFGFWGWFGADDDNADIDYKETDPRCAARRDFCSN